MSVPIGCDRKSIFHGEINHFLVSQVKPLVRHLLRLIDKGLPEPTKQNTIRPNSHILVDMMDDFFSKERNNRDTEFRAITKIIILMFDGDYYYWERMEYEINELYKKIQSGEWELRTEKPRLKWWGNNDLCPLCFRVKGSERVFADCPAEYH